MTEKSSYRAAGVDIDAQDEALREIKSVVRQTHGPNVVSEIGSFGGLFRASFPEMENPILVSSADGVGTKLTVAKAMRIHDTVGGDLVNHCVDDILVQGARPLFFLDYFATGKLQPRIMVDVVRGMAAACSENGLALLGGETAEMPGMYAPDEYDVAGFIVGVVDEANVITGDAVVEGDVIIGLPSVGLHTNGYSLARKVLIEQCGHDYQTIVPEIGGKVGEILLAPHISYKGPILPLVDEGRIHAMAHITGGGLTDNLPRVLPPGLNAKIKLGSWEILPIFKYLYEKGEIEVEEMLRVFNMGVGMAIIVSKDDVDAVTGRFSTYGQKYFFIGNIVEGSGKVVYDFPPSGFASWLQ